MKIRNLIILISLASCVGDNMDKPNPKKIPYELQQHGDIRLDNYYWMRDDSRSDIEIINYLKSENDYADKWFSSMRDNKTEIIEDLIDQLPEEELSYPLLNNEYEYYQKTSRNDQLPRYYRKSSDGEETLYLDPNIKLKNQDYYNIGSIEPSPDNNLIAYLEDNNGRREYDVKIINASNLDIIDDEIKDSASNIIWSRDNKFVIYLKKDPITLINNSVYIHRIGSSATEDKLLFKENDQEYNLDLYSSKSKQYAYIEINSTNQNELRLIDLNNPLLEPKLFIKRSDDHLYYIEHIKDKEFFIRTNLNSPNFKILRTDSYNNIDIENLEIIVPHDKSIFINDIFVVANKLILEVRENGLPEIKIFDLNTKKTVKLKHKDNAYSISLNSRNKKNINGFYFNYSSLTSPNSLNFYNLSSNDFDIVWQKEISNFNKNDYVDDRFFYQARDGVNVPATLIYRKDTDISKAPILFYGYGSYGINREANFNSSLIPLLNRGFIYAILNIRGGGEMGKHWYEDGRMFKKMNTFYDFNDGVRFILDKGIGDKNNVFARGGSAGGLLMGAIINLEPSLYKGILSGVPFVDVLTTMSDPTIPLTTFEYGEWGNPANEDEYFYMKQYSPYDNIIKTEYPAVFITSSLYDSQVQYYEPAKYTAKLREYNRSENPILLKMNLIGGHGGLSGKINQFNEIAEEYNFIINLVN